jgi:lipoprotein-releasing system permease protein
MNFPLYIAKRYIFAKKSRNAINIISGISVGGVAIGTMALVIVLSVFNGFDDLIRKLFNTFDPDLKVTIVEGKHFTFNPTVLKNLGNIKGVEAFSKVLEDNALMKYGEKQFPATFKGVDEHYLDVNGLDSMIVDGTFKLTDKHGQYAVVGQGIAYNLQIGLKFINPIIVYVPPRGASMAMTPNQKFIFPSGIFAVEQEHDVKYMIVPIKFAYELLEDSTILSAIEIKMAKNADQKLVQKEVQKLFGDQFIVKNHYQQNELFYRIMKYEKWTIFMILSFILMVASFNIIGSLSMLIIEKKKDISTFQSIGADRSLISRIFLFEGMMISFFGAVLGLILGLTICWLQVRYGFVKLQGSGSFIIDAYPVSIRMPDIILGFLTVLVIGYLAAWYPVRFIIKKYLPENQFTFY